MKGRGSRLLKWVAALVVLVEAVLVWGGVVDFAKAAAVVIAVEAALALVAAVGAWRIRAEYRTRLPGAPDRFTAFVGAIKAVLPHPLGGLLAFELSLQRAVLLWTRRRRDVPADAVGIAYHGQLGTMLGILAGVTVVEAVVVHLALPWETFRWILLAFSLIGLWWLAAFAMSLVVYPTTVGPDLMRIRFSAWVDILLPLGEIEDVAVVNRSRSQRRTAMFHGDALVVEVFNCTNIKVLLATPVTVKLPKEGSRDIREIHLWADDPRECVRLLNGVSDAR
ncbi:hypothetical protein GCM10022221_44020 [Actinocorallia aurea]